MSHSHVFLEYYYHSCKRSTRLWENKKSSSISAITPFWSHFLSWTFSQFFLFWRYCFVSYDSCLISCSTVLCARMEKYMETSSRRAKILWWLSWVLQYYAAKCRTWRNIVCTLSDSASKHCDTFWCTYRPFILRHCYYMFCTFCTSLWTLWTRWSNKSKSKNSEIRIKNFSLCVALCCSSIFSSLFCNTLRI